MVKLLADLFADYPMLVLGAEAFTALALLIFIVWFTAGVPRRPLREEPAGEGQPQDTQAGDRHPH